MPIVTGTGQNQRQPMPSLGRMMVFVDGENLVYRFEDEIDKKGKTPGNDVLHENGIYVWVPATVSDSPSGFRIRAALYPF